MSYLLGQVHVFAHFRIIHYSCIMRENDADIKLLCFVYSRGCIVIQVVIYHRKYIVAQEILEYNIPATPEKKANIKTWPWSGAINGKVY